MQYLDLTLPTPAENVALDEALLEEAEASASPVETLRLWEPRQPLVVVGRSSRADGEVRIEVCRELGIPVLRRISGGAAVVSGPGCLMYALVLSYHLRPELRSRHGGPSLGVGHVGRGAGGLCAGRSVPGHERSGLGRIEVLRQ